MELVTRIDADSGCTSLLLDDFMQGLIYKLFLDKWNTYGYKLHYVRRLIDFIILALLITMAMALKFSIEYQTAMYPVCIALVVLMSINIVEEITVGIVWVRENRGEGDAKLSNRKLFEQFRTFCQMHSTNLLIVSYLLTFLTCVTIFTGDLVDASKPLKEAAMAAMENATHVRRALKSGGNVGASAALPGANSGLVPVAADTVVDMFFVADVEETSGQLWLVMGFANFTMFQYFTIKLFAPFESLNIFLLSVGKMLKRDLVIFMLLFGFFMANFYFTLYVMYPRSGDTYLPQVMPFNSWYSALRALIELAFTGSASAVNLEPENFQGLTTSQQAALAVWMTIYLFYVIFSMILLLNLLIAMLSFTFDTVREESTLQCRTSFAQLIMRLELLATSLGMNINVGEDKGDKFTFDFRSVVTSVEGSIVNGSSDPFAKADRGGGAAVKMQEKIEGRLEEMDEKIMTVSTDLKKLATALGHGPPEAAYGEFVSEKLATRAQFQKDIEQKLKQVVDRDTSEAAMDASTAAMAALFIKKGRKKKASEQIASSAGTFTGGSR